HAAPWLCLTSSWCQGLLPEQEQKNVFLSSNIHCLRNLYRGFISPLHLSITIAETRKNCRADFTSAGTEGAVCTPVFNNGTVCMH
ncbi:MAG: hypothetical protein OES39_06955, partial [Desulfobulbaceae bacterium]|nr:hypothetical protein [Desulfobulbaceae bacterium]